MLLAAQRRTGKPVRVLSKRPNARPDLECFWWAFWSLHPTRLRMEVPQPIQPEAIAAYLEIHGLTSPRDRPRYYGLVTAIDQRWLRWYHEKSKDGQSRKSKARD